MTNGPRSIRSGARPHSTLVSGPLDSGPVLLRLSPRGCKDFFSLVDDLCLFAQRRDVLTEALLLHLVFDLHALHRQLLLPLVAIRVVTTIGTHDVQAVV